jgi:hypothetical protein
MNLPLFPDVNVWVALNFEMHAHHATAKRWYEAIPPSATIVCCRQTQLGLFRILTTAAVMGQEVIYDQWISTGQVAWAEDPRDLEAGLRAFTARATSSPKTWMDAYLAAFAEAGGLTLVTFDRALAGRVKGAVLLS